MHTKSTHKNTNHFRVLLLHLQNSTAFIRRSRIKCMTSSTPPRCCSIRKIVWLYIYLENKRRELSDQILRCIRYNPCPTANISERYSTISPSPLSFYSSCPLAPLSNIYKYIGIYICKITHRTTLITIKSGMARRRSLVSSTGRA